MRYLISMTTLQAEKPLSNLPLFLAAGIAVVILIVLGTWQLQRLQWKQALMTARQTAVAAAPLTELPTGDGSAVAFRRLRLTGTYDSRVEFHLSGQSLTDSRGMSQAGWHVVTPFTLTDGATVMVDRGFVPYDLKDPSRRAPVPMGVQTIEGLIRPAGPRGWMVPENDVRQNVWFTRDAEVMAKAAGLAGVVPFTLDLVAASPPTEDWPRGGQTRLDLPNNHLQYALTWYSLAGVLIIVTGLFARARTRSAAQTKEEWRG
jgi:surfeit locus 1 family protein